MDSRHPRSPDGEAVPLRGAEQVAAGLHARRKTILAAPRIRALSGIGDVGRAARRFSAMTFQSASVRRLMEARRQGTDVGNMLVRPPDYWSGHTDEDLGVRSRQSTGDAALDALIQKRGTKRREQAAPIRLQRGLPSTIHRRSHSVAGPLTAPGGMARRLLPAVVVPAANPANSPQTAAARAPKSRPARAGGRDADPRPRPAAPPAGTLARALATSAAPSELDPRSMPRPSVPAAESGTPARTANGAAAAASGGQAVAVAGSTGSTSTAASASAPLRRAASDLAADLAVDLPPWPGDDVDVADNGRTDLVARSVGRQVAVQPLLSGWRSPTAWRSIAGAPGVRLLPAGRAAFASAWSAPAADAPAASWSETVRRAIDERAASPDAVRSLPVGGPAVILRDRAETTVAQRAGRSLPVVTAPAGRATPSSPSGTPAAARTAAPGAMPGAAAARAGSPVPGSASARSGSPSAGRADTVAASRAPAANGVAGTVARSTSAGSRSTGTRAAATTWASSPGAVVRRQVVPSTEGAGVELTRWVPAAGLPAVTATPQVVLPGARHELARRPGQWLARATSPLASSSAGATARVPMGPLGPVRWSNRADQPVVARSATGASSSWAASVAAAASTMAGGGGLVAASRTAPVGGGLTLVRGGSAGGADLPVPTVQRVGNHPAANRLRLVPPAAAPATSARITGSDAGPVARRTADQATSGAPAGRSSQPSTSANGTSDLATSGAAATSGRSDSAMTSTRGSSALGDSDGAVLRSPAGAAYVGRAAVAPSPFVSIPGAVAAHGLPSATSPLVGVTASGAVPGRPAGPGALGRLVHGEPVRRRSLLESAPPAIVLRQPAVPAAVASSGDRFRLPSGPAAVARRRAGMESTRNTSTTTSAPGRTAASLPSAASSSSGTLQRSAVPRQGNASATTGNRAVAGVPWSANGSATTGNRAVAGAPWSASGSAPTGNRAVAGAPWSASPAAGGPTIGGSPAGGAATTWAQRVAAAAAVTASGAGQVASLRRLPVAPGLIVSSGSPERAGSPAESSPRTTTSAPTGSNVVHRSRTPHGVSATVARHRAHHPEQAGIARRWQGADVPARSLPGAAPSRLRPLVAPPAGTASRQPAPAVAAPRSTGASWSERVAASAGTGPRLRRAATEASTDGPAPHVATARILRAAPPAPAAGTPVVRPLRPNAPGAAARFDEVLRSTGEPVRAMPLPVRYRPLAERIIGRMPVKIATGAASRRALAAVGANAATTSSVIHLPVAPDGSARTASLLAHELTHVAAGSPVARFHGGAPSIEETAASQIERIVARAARTGGLGKAPSVIDTKALPVAGFVGPRGATAGPPVPASAGTSSSSGSGAVSAADMVARMEGGGSATSSIQRTPDTSVRRKGRDRASEDLEQPESSPTIKAGASRSEAAGGLTEAAFDAIVQALEARLLESIERRGGMWRGGF